MRLALIVRRYLDWIEGGARQDSISHDTIIDGYIDEVQSILSDWDTVCYVLRRCPHCMTEPTRSMLIARKENLLQMATDHSDIWLCVDVLFNSYTMLIVLYQSKKSEQGGSLPCPAIYLARKSVKTFQSLLESSSYWGIRYADPPHPRPRCAYH